MEYKYPIYFQSKGGWGKMHSKKINKDFTLITEIKSDNNFNIYSETSPYLKFLNTIDELITLSEVELYNGLLCYVEDISMLKSMEYNDGNNNENYSHYFILDNVAFSTRLGLVGECCGWKNIRINEFDGIGSLTQNGKKILYLESVILDEKGNNSHTGKGNYDDGIEYFNLYKNLFAKDVELGATRKVTDENDIIAIEKAGFKLSKYIKNNNKVYFFGEVDDANGLDKLSNDKFYNPETKKDDSRDEMAANSIINTKHLTLKFFTNNNNDMKDYIKNVVLKYAYEMIPSTSIVEVLFDNEESLFNSPESKEEKYTLSWSINNSAINN